MGELFKKQLPEPKYMSRLFQRIRSHLILHRQTLPVSAALSLQRIKL